MSSKVAKTIDAEGAAQERRKGSDARELQAQLTAALASRPHVVTEMPESSASIAEAALEPAKIAAAKTDAPEVGPPLERRKPSSARIWFGRLIKSLIALAILISVVWAPMQVMLQPSSVEAVVNARLVVLRAPIDGQMATDGLPKPGETVENGRSLFQIENPRIDHSAVEVLEQQIAAILAERPALTRRLEAARAEEADLDAQLKAFRDARVTVIDLDIAVLDQQILIEEQRWVQVSNDAARAETLRAAGAMAPVAAEKAKTNQIISAATVAELKLRRKRLSVERDALAGGVFIGDSYNDRPQSAQRRDEVRRRIDELEADLAASAARESSLKLARDRAMKQQSALAKAEIIVPQRSRVWEVLATPGEQINRGQDLVRLLSCEEAVVTVAVNETVYNSLYLGMPAEFIPRGASNGLVGTIVNLTGMAGASSNYAIDPSALVKEPYRATVAIPSLASADKCDIGRTGRVMFGESTLQSSNWRFLNTARSFFQ